MSSTACAFFFFLVCVCLTMTQYQMYSQHCAEHFLNTTWLKGKERIKMSASQIVKWKAAVKALSQSSCSVVPHLRRHALYICAAWLLTVAHHENDRAEKKIRHLEVYSCHTVERGGFFPRLLCSYNHQFSSVVASQPLSIPAVFDTIYLLYWSRSFLIINLPPKGKKK